MNILAASSRQWHPEDEWILQGIQNLLQDVLAPPVNWVLFDKNPDLLRSDGLMRRRTLHSNSYHHQSLIPFSMAIIGGSATWHNRGLETFYHLVARSKIPLFALGLGLPEEARALNKDELHCFKRRSTVITARDIAAKNYFRQYGLEAAMLPCPSLFAAKAQPVATNSQPRIGFVIDDHQAKVSPNHQSFLRELCKFIEHSSDSYDLQVFCPTVDEFMRFSSMFGERTHYSFEAREYPKLLASADLIVTNNLTCAHLANSVGRIALFVSETAPNELEFAQLPFIRYATLESLSQQFEAIVGKTHTAAGIESWKHKIREQWRQVLPARNAPIGPAERQIS
ncbi:MAG: polysaccharide pyruvyl transferase family protein [Bdellovibrionota bacterium]